MVTKELNGADIRIRPERSVFYSVVWPLVVVSIAVVLINDRMGWAGFIIWAMEAYLVWRLLWNLFGFEEIVVAPGVLTITKRVLFWHRTRRCEGDNIDWIAYHPSGYRSPPGIGVLLKDKVSPFGVAYDIGPEDAETVLQAIKAGAPWLGTRVRATTELSYYKLN